LQGLDGAAACGAGGGAELVRESSEIDIGSAREGRGVINDDAARSAGLGGCRSRRGAPVDGTTGDIKAHDAAVGEDVAAGCGRAEAEHAQENVVVTTFEEFSDLQAGH